jgi:hypothetical protein
MPVTFNCSCGRQMRAADEHAGKRVKCPGCEAINLVPQPPPPAEPELVQFRCSCGQILHARAEHVGKLTRCTVCGDKVRIPAAADTKKTGGSSAANPKIKTNAAPPPPPARRPPARQETRRKEPEEVEEIEEVQEAQDAEVAEVAEEVEVYDDRPRKKKKGRRSGRGWGLLLVLGGVGVFLLLLACGGGIGLYFYMRTPDDLKYIPDDAQDFTSLRPADLMKFDKGKDAAKGLVQGDNGVSGTGLELAEVERLTTVTYKVDNSKTLTWTIILTVGTPDKKKIVSKLFKDGSTETKYKDKVIVKSDAKNEIIRPGFPNPGGFPQPNMGMLGAPTAICFVSDKIFILGDQSAIEKALDKYPREKSEGVIASGVKLASRNYHMVMAHSGGLFGFGGKGDDLPEGTVVAGSLLTDNIVDFKMIMTYSTSEKAQSARTKADDERTKRIKELENKSDEKSRKELRMIRDTSLSLSGKELTVSLKASIEDSPSGRGIGLFPF